nr:MAG TPA: hypothetical protein [Caudoviricetes sp.]
MSIYIYIYISLIYKIITLKIHAIILHITPLKHVKK